MAGTKRSGRKSQAANDFLEPKPPINVVGTDVGTNRAYNDGAASVAFELPAGSPPATSYTVLASTGQSATGASSPIVVGGIATGANPTFTVTATNASGTSLPSSPSLAVPITTVPATPNAPTVTSPVPSASPNVAGTQTDSVSWLAPATGGKAISNYEWVSTDAKSGTTASTSVSVNQEGGTSQQYKVRAYNANGWGAYSSNSSPATTTFAFTPYSFTPYSFTPFAFTPFAFTPYSFTPYSFTPFSFTPMTFSFTPVAYSFTPMAYAFTPYSFTPKYSFAFSFTPSCIDEQTMLEVVGAGDTVEYREAKDIRVGDLVWSYKWNQLLDETQDPHAQQKYSEIDGMEKVQTTITAVEEYPKDKTIYFNNDEFARFSLEEKLFIKRNGIYMFEEAKNITLNDSIFLSGPAGMEEVPVTGMQIIEEDRKVYKLNASPVDTVIAGSLIVHNAKGF